MEHNKRTGEAAEESENRKRMRTTPGQGGDDASFDRSAELIALNKGLNEYVKEHNHEHAKIISMIQVDGEGHRESYERGEKVVAELEKSNKEVTRLTKELKTARFQLQEEKNGSEFRERIRVRDDKIMGLESKSTKQANIIDRLTDASQYTGEAEHVRALQERISQLEIQAGDLELAKALERKAVEDEHKARECEEAKKLDTEWIMETNAKIPSLNVALGIIVHSPGRFTAVHRRIVREIVRRSSPHHRTMKEYAQKAFVDLEYQLFVWEDCDISSSDRVNSASFRWYAKQDVSTDDARFVVRQVTLKHRRIVLQSMITHPWYKRSDAANALNLLQSCVEFFDRRFTYQVGQIVGKELDRSKQHMRLGGDDYTASIKDLEVGSYKECQVNSENKKTWDALTC